MQAVYDTTKELTDPVEIMRFTLRYSGPLPARQKRRSQILAKHVVRQQLHLQLRELWRTRTPLKSELREWTALGVDERDAWEWKQSDFSPNGAILHSSNTGPFTFVPLVTTHQYLVCELDIIFLRPGPIGDLFRQDGHRGDLDNRLKVLLDALQMPDDIAVCAALPAPSPDETPFFCLLENDRLVTGLRVETRQLLEAKAAERSHVELIIDVHVKAQTLTFRNLSMGAD